MEIYALEFIKNANLPKSDFDSQDYLGNTILHDFCRNNMKRCILELIKNKKIKAEHLKIKNRGGQIPSDLGSQETKILFNYLDKLI
jgi:HD superfamily phosphohydrolase YqeK